MRQLAQKLSCEFSYENLEELLIRKNRDFTVLRQRLYDLEENLNEIFPIEQAYKFAEVKLKDYVQFIVFVIKTNEPLTERRSKKKQYEVAKRLLRSSFVNVGLFIFHDEEGNFRFSLVYRISQGTRSEFSYYKRATFYVSPKRNNKTFIIQIGDCNFATFDEIKKAFSIEPVTKQFYDEIQSWYLWAMDNVKFPDDYKYSENPEKDREIRNATNLIRLITRIIFIWFLKEKGLIPEILFNERDLKEIVKDFGNKHNYYNAILQNLFFATLNSKKDQRGWAKNEGFPKNKSNYGVKTLFRYEDKFLINENEVLELFKDIPFLNGGLFDCLDKENQKGKVIYIDGFSRNPEKQAMLPDYLFFQENELRINLSNYGLGANKTFRGLINILRSYNFTTDEATPIDQEIALDPELLGKVFENLLASYNPETATTARKATGSYYTPREIVDYMVEESLREYLKTKLPDINQHKLDILLSYSEKVPDFSDEEKQKIISAIDEIKILDPACGSGAFPMGILHKLVYILQKIDPDNKLWYELQYQKALKASEQVFKEKDKLEREQMLKEINEAFDESINYPDYARKLYLIENCIYGVDIQQIAIQISKLRFFISLVLDQKVDRTKENFGIRPLPNLETKFISANTLIGLEKPRQLNIRSPEIENKEKELKDIRHRYFTAKTRTEKRSLQEKDRKIRQKIALLLINDGWGEQTANKIASFDLFDQNASADWFDPEWMFGLTDGFDIVIGNPPYGNILGKDINKNTKKFVLKIFKYSTPSDISSPFIEMGFNLLKKKGNLVFIITYAITFNKDFSKSRELIANNFERVLIYTFDRDRCRIFKSMTQSVSILKCFNKNVPIKEGIYTSRMFRETPDINSIEVTNCNGYLLPKNSSYSQSHRLPKIGEKINRQILEKLLQFNYNVGSVIKNNGSKIWIRTSGNYWYNAFDMKPYDSSEISFLYVDKDFADFIILLMNSSIFYFWFRIYGDGRHMNVDILESFPLPDREKILKFNILLNKVRTKFMDKLFSVFDKEHNRFITSSIKSEIDLIDLILGKYFYNLDYEEIIHILNYDFEVRGGCKLEEKFYTLVDQILSAKKQNPDADTSHLEHQIDQLVYKLYDLTEEEIKIIEGDKWK